MVCWSRKEGATTGRLLGTPTGRRVRRGAEGSLGLVNAQIVKIEQREAETRVQILPHPDYGAAAY